LHRCYLEMHQLSYSWGLVPDGCINYANAGNLVHSATEMGSVLPFGVQAYSTWRLDCDFLCHNGLYHNILQIQCNAPQADLLIDINPLNTDRRGSEGR
jgi:hypothetical protein